eukprot:268780-Amorphochlora_amoeboformis.AAC.4
MFFEAKRKRGCSLSAKEDRAGVPTGEQDPVPDPPRYAQERAHVQAIRSQEQCLDWEEEPQLGLVESSRHSGFGATVLGQQGDGCGGSIDSESVPVVACVLARRVSHLDFAAS